MSSYYLPSCAFSRTFPEESRHIQAYASSHLSLELLGCCEGVCRDPDFLQPGDTVVYICHNCEAIVKESHPEVNLVSIWELIDQDPEFVFPDYRGKEVLLQDCWRTNDCPGEQAAVRSLMGKAHLSVRELPRHGAEADFCGASLYRPTSPKNIDLAPHRFTVLGAGLFTPHSEEEQRRLMRDYCKAHISLPVVAYCKHCVEGLTWGGADCRHLGSLLFTPSPW